MTLTPRHRPNWLDQAAIDVAAPNSYEHIVHMGILERMKTMSMFEPVKQWAQNRHKGPVQKENLPFFGCYFMESRAVPDGDSNAGCPAFVDRLKLGFSVIILSNDEKQAHENLDRAYWAIMKYLHRQDWFRFPMPPPMKPIDCEGVEGHFHRFVFGNTAIDNETPVAELQLDVTLKWRTMFPPLVEDPLKTVHVTIDDRYKPFTAEWTLEAAEPTAKKEESHHESSR
jgi:hypothetical protein